METLTQLTLQNLERTSKNWDKRTKTILLAVGGHGNMFGGSGRMMHITLHGDNSVIPTGTITIEGVVTSSYNIARGANGETSQQLSYYKGLDNFTDLPNHIAFCQIGIQGSCGGAQEALCTILSAEIDWLVNPDEIKKTTT